MADRWDEFSERLRDVETREVHFAGSGDPNAVVSAAMGAQYWDWFNDDLWVNDDGLSSWKLVGGAGGITGGGLANQVAYFTAPNVIAGDVGMMYAAGLNTLTVGNVIIATGGNILPADAAGQDLGDATHRWDTFASYVNLPDGGWIGIAGNELLTVNAAGTFAFSGIAGVSVEDGDWIGIGAAAERIEYHAAGCVAVMGANLGVGTITPGLDIGSAAGDVPANEPVLQLTSTTNTAHLVVEGERASQYWVDRGGAVNDKVLELYVDGGEAKFLSRQDNLVTPVSDNILIMDLDTGYVGLGTVPGAALEVESASTNPLVIFDGNHASAFISTQFYRQGINKCAFGLWRTAGGTFGANDFYFATNDGAWHDMFAFKNDGAAAYFASGVNLGIGTLVFGANAATVLGIANGTAPTTSPANMIQVFSVDCSDAAATLGLRTEQAVEAGAPTPSHKLKVLINGTEYWLSLDAV